MNLRFAQHSRLTHRAKLVFVALAALVVVLAFLLAHNFIDFPVYYATGRSLLSGRTDLYSPDFALGRVMDYRYPPFFLLALFPLWLLPYQIAAYVWALLQAIEIIGCAVIVGRTFQASRSMWLAIAFAAAQYFVMALHYGNAQLLVVFLMFGSFYLLLRGRDISAALLMALAITFKLTPILLLPYFAMKKRWTMLAGVVVFLITINIAPSAYFGFRENNQLLTSWYEHVVASQEFHEENGPINLSLKGEFRRYLSSVDYSQRVDGDVNYPAVNLASLSRDRVVTVWVFIAGVTFIGVLLLMWRLGKQKKGRALDPERDVSMPLELSVMICLILFLGPLTSKIYFTALLWPLACLAELATNRNKGEGRLGRYTLLFLAGANCVLPLLPGRSIQRLLLVLGTDFYLNCLLLFCLLYFLFSRRRSHRIQSGEAQTPILPPAKMP